MDRRAFLRLLSGSLAAAGAGVWTPGCSGEKRGRTARRDRDRPRLVVLYAPCTVNKFYTSPYAPEVTYTPNLARFARDAAVFGKHQSEAGTTGVSYASMLSGGHAGRHGIFFHPNAIDPSVYLLTEAFRDNGYDVHYWGSHKMANYELNYAQGTPRDQAHSGSLTDPSGLAEFDRIVKRVRSDPEYKAFVFTNFTLSHSPYPGRHGVPDDRARAAGFFPWKLERYGALYDRHVGFDLHYNFDHTVRETMGLDDAEIEEFIRAVELFYERSIEGLDEDFGKVIDRIDDEAFLESSLLLFTADHGEVIARKNALFRFCHGFQLAPEVQSVPFLIRGPRFGIRPGRREFVTRSIDLFPTLVELCGLEIEEEHLPLGYDLTGVLLGEEESPALPGYSHTAIPPVRWGNIRETRPEAVRFHGFFPDQSPETMWASVRIGDRIFKWHRTDPARPEFVASMFDLRSDPDEERDLFDPSDREHARVLEDLQAYRDGLVEAFHSWAEHVPANRPDADDLEQLRKLGYI
jgi:arylsulfatase A-like enzyme